MTNNLLAGQRHTGCDERLDDLATFLLRRGRTGVDLIENFKISEGLPGKETRGIVHSYTKQGHQRV